MGCLVDFPLHRSLTTTRPGLYHDKQLDLSRGLIPAERRDVYVQDDGSMGGFVMDVAGYLSAVKQIVKYLANAMS